MGFVDISDSDAIAEPMELRVKYKIGKQIGEGNFAVVKECTEKYVFIVSVLYCKLQMRQDGYTSYTGISRLRRNWKFSVERVMHEERLSALLTTTYV